MARRGERLLRAVSQTPWAIMPEKLEAILDVIEFRMAGVELAAEDVRGQFRPSDRAAASESGGVAVLPLVGVISHRMNMMSNFSGGTSTEKFGARFDELMSNQDIGTIVIDVDSPGGTVEGVAELSRKIYEAREGGDKRIVAISNALMASAAYWIGSSADEVVITPTGQAGSIGVFSVHTEFSEMEAEAGITRTLVKAGRFKGELNDFEPLSEEAEGHLQATVDEYFDLFVEGVARNRAMSEDAVRSGMGQGRVLPARQAVDAGLADRIASFEDVLEELGVEGASAGDVRAEAGPRPKAGEPQSDREVQVLGPDGDVAGTMEAPDEDETDEFAGAEAEETTDASTEDADSPQVAAEREGGRREIEDSRETAAHTAVKEEPMSKESDTASGDGAAAVQTEERDQERERAARITRLCAMHGMEEQASEFIAEGLSVGQVQDRIFEEGGSADEPINHTPKDPAGLTEEDSERYSLARAIRTAAQGDQMPGGFELDVHQELESKLGGTRNGGFLVPTHLGPLPDRFQGSRPNVAPRPQAALDAGTATEGQEFVFTEPGSFIEMLRARMVTTMLGATFLPGLEGNVSFPKQTGAGTFTWRAEEPGSDVSDSQASTDQVQLQPNDGTSSTAYSRRLLAQSVIDVEQFIRNDLAAIAARGIDKAALHGAGGNEPTGLYNATGVGSVAMGGAITWDKVVDLETEVVADDADIGAMAYATTPEVRGNAKTTEKASNTAQFLWEGSVREGEMNGFRAMASNQIEKTLGTGSDEHGILFGVWDQLLIGEWGALEIVVDPYSMKKQGLVEVTLFVIADVAIRHPEAFAKGTGLTIA